MSSGDHVRPFLLYISRKTGDCCRCCIPCCVNIANGCGKSDFVFTVHKKKQKRKFFSLKIINISKHVEEHDVLHLKEIDKKES
jgi:hypothetical protein